MDKLKLAVIGCGAMAEKIHLPVIAYSDQVDVAVLVDKLLPRARQLADCYDVPGVADDYREIIGKADAAIVALPHYLHAPVTTNLLRHGIHVLVEKPMALKASDCDEMIKAANNAGTILAVGMVCRFYEASQFLKQLIGNGLLGNILSFDLRQGNIYSWPVTDDSMFRKETGGGVLTGTGPHALDMLLWWIGDYDTVEYYDDAMGGVEADCELHLKLQNAIRGFVEFSRTRNLRNTYVIEGEHGILEVGTDFNPLVRLRTKNQDVVLAGRIMRGSVANKTILDAFYRQLNDFTGAILGHREPFVPGKEGKRVVELIEACCALRQPLKQPWMFPETPVQDVLEDRLK